MNRWEVRPFLQGKPKNADAAAASFDLLLVSAYADGGRWIRSSRFLFFPDPVRNRRGGAVGGLAGELRQYEHPWSRRTGAGPLLCVLAFGLRHWNPLGDGQGGGLAERKGIDV